MYSGLGAGKELFAVLVTGQLVSSFSSLMLVSVTFFSEVWFSPTERVIATAFSAVIGPKVKPIPILDSHSKSFPYSHSTV